MGLLHIGTPLTWDETCKHADHVREHGVAQFLHIWDKAKDRQGDKLLWGDEIEYMIVAFDGQTRNAKLSLRQSEIRANLNEIATNLKGDTSASISVPTYHCEYTRYMLESSPGSPYTGSIQDLLSVESNMRYRRHLNDNEVPMTVTSFPRLGAPGVFTEPYFSADSAMSSQSFFLPDEITIQLVHYLIISVNIRSRRGSKIAINVPIFIDDRTPRPFVDPTIPWQRSLYPQDPEAKNGAALTDHIYMDSIAFGMGCCCLQLTLQCHDIGEAMHMYDSLIPVTPIMLALSAASPIWRGYLSDVDCRWNVVCGSVDDRTAEERGCSESKSIVPKSRGDSVSLYLSTDRNNKAAYNDIDVPYNQELYTRLVDHGVDELLSKHIAHIFIRDPLSLFWETIDQDDENSNNHFENLQSTNWQTLRFKPPPPNSAIGWRVEFRSMDVQLTDFENAAFCVFIVLLSRAILAFNVNFYIPMSKVDENMQRAQKRDAVRTGKLFFRKNVLPPGCMSPTMNAPSAYQCCSPIEQCNGVPPKERKLQNCFPRPPPPSTIENSLIEDEYEEMSMEEIFNGKGTTFPGLIGLVEAYLDTLDTNPSERQQINKYVDLIRRRANGTLLTAASWMRDFVRSHPAYKFDSVVSQGINYDLMVAIDEIERGVLRVPQLLPQGYSPSQVVINGLKKSKCES